MIRFCGVGPHPAHRRCVFQDPGQPWLVLPLGISILGGCSVMIYLKTGDRNPLGRDAKYISEEALEAWYSASNPSKRQSSKLQIINDNDPWCMVMMQTLQVIRWLWWLLLMREKTQDSGGCTWGTSFTHKSEMHPYLCTLCPPGPQELS